MILKNRLAKGEITTDEFDILKKKLVESESVKNLKIEIGKVNEKMEKMSKEQSSTRWMTSRMQQKSIGFTALLSILPGIVGLMGLGYLHVGEKRKGIVFLIVGLLIVIFSIGFVNLPNWSGGLDYSAIFALAVMVGIPYLILYVFQIIDSIRSCHKHNRRLDQIGSM